MRLHLQFRAMPFILRTASAAEAKMGPVGRLILGRGELEKGSEAFTVSLGFVNRRLRPVGRGDDELRMEPNANVQVPKAKSENQER